MTEGTKRREKIWKPFGEAEKPIDNQAVLYEDVFIDDGSEKQEEVSLIEENTAVVCRNCGGNHWTAKCPMTKKDADKKAKETTGGAYVPPSKRSGNKDTGSGNTYVTDEYPTIKISNLTTEANENDVRELVQGFGNVKRVRLPVYQETKEKRGIAFVSFSKKYI